MTRLEVAREAVSRMILDDNMKPLMMAVFEKVYLHSGDEEFIRGMLEKCPPEEVDSITRTVQVEYLKGFTGTENAGNN